METFTRGKCRLNKLLGLGLVTSEQCQLETGVYQRLDDGCPKCAIDLEQVNLSCFARSGLVESLTPTTATRVSSFMLDGRRLDSWTVLTAFLIKTWLGNGQQSMI